MKINKSLVMVLLAVAVMVLSSIACSDGGTVVDDAGAVRSVVSEVTNITKAFGPLNEQLFGSDGAPQCVYTYRSGEQITKDC